MLDECIFNGEENPFPAVGDAACHQHAGGGPSHGHGQRAQKIGKDRARCSGDIVADRQTNTQSDIVNTILRNRPVTTVLIHRLRDWLVLISRVINACTADITYHAIMAGAIY